MSSVTAAATLHMARHMRLRKMLLTHSHLMVAAIIKMIFPGCGIKVILCTAGISKMRCCRCMILLAAAVTEMTFSYAAIEAVLSAVDITRFVYAGKMILRIIVYTGSSIAGAVK